jgi:DNA-binding transcriptional LysR family regulator
MDSLSGILAFVRAAEMRSFVAAGERLGLSASAVGKGVARLEEKLGVRLLNRSTRRISLTEEGTLFFERCQRIVGEIEEAEAELSRLMDTPRGRLRVSLPAVGYRMLLPILPAFAQRFPDIELDLDFNDRLIDVIAEGVDAVIRSGDLGNSQLKVRELGPFRFVLVGAPDYFTKRGVPQVPRELEQHACLRYKFPTTGQLQDWNLKAVATDPPPLLPTTLTFNSVEALIFAAVRGLGIAYLPDFAVRESLATGALNSVLDGYLSDGGKFSVLWPSNRHLLPKLRVFVDFLTENLDLGSQSSVRDGRGGGGL